MKMRFYQHPSIEMYTNQNFWINRKCPKQLIFLQGGIANFIAALTLILGVNKP